MNHCQVVPRVILCVFIAVGIGGCGPLTMTIGGAAGNQELKTKVVEADRGWQSNRVAMIDVSGLIYNAHKSGVFRRGENPVSLLHEKLELARCDTRTKAVILRLNTPGGTVTASDAMYRQVLRFKKRSGKPVIALMMDVTASGGYYLACAADKIICYPTSITGSIGVIVQTLSVKPALDRFGIRAEAITSGSNKDIGSPLSEMTDEKRAVLQALVDDFYNQFASVVRQARPAIDHAQFPQIADGRIFSGAEAVKVGLVDEVGDLTEAFKVAKNLAGIKWADLILYHRPYDYIGSPYAGSSRSGRLISDETRTQINFAQFNFSESFGQASTGFFYLWTGASP